MGAYQNASENVPVHDDCNDFFNHVTFRNNVAHLIIIIITIKNHYFSGVIEIQKLI